MKFTQSTILLFATLALAVHGEGDGHGDHGHKCACEAEEFDFKIDCSNKAVMEDAMAALQSENCAADSNCDEDADNSCFRNWLIVQSHHDYCPEDLMPQVRDVVSLFCFDFGLLSCSFSNDVVCFIYLFI